MPLRRSFSAGELATRQRHEIREDLARKEDPQLTSIRMLKDGVEVPMNPRAFRRLLAHDMIALTFCDARSSVSYWIQRGQWPPIWTNDFRVLLATSNVLDSYDRIPNDAAHLLHRQSLAAAAEAAAAYEFMFGEDPDEVLSRPPTPGQGLFYDSDSDSPSAKELDKNGGPGGASSSHGAK